MFYILFSVLFHILNMHIYRWNQCKSAQHFVKTLTLLVGYKKIEGGAGIFGSKNKSGLFFSSNVRAIIFCSAARGAKITKRTFARNF